ncbi:MAG: hypothetical protein MJZ25_03655 [Fibrobacter sp.]|nr:hypothetical protein [Fibrobacter sp.]
MIDMYDLPTEAEMAKDLFESAKKQKSEIKVNEIETKTIFPFWEPHSGKGMVDVLSDKTGVVKAKDDFKSTDVGTAWTDFLKKVKTAGNKPVTETDTFGSVVVNSYAAKPNPDKLVGSIKALKKTNVKDMSGKTTSKTEELGVYKVLAKSNAAEPNPDKLVGIVKPISKKALENFTKKPKVVDVSGCKVAIGKDFFKETKLWEDAYETPCKVAGKKEPKGPAVVCDKTGIVKPPKSK